MCLHIFALGTQTRNDITTPRQPTSRHEAGAGDEEINGKGNDRDRRMREKVKFGEYGNDDDVCRQQQPRYEGSGTFCGHFASLLTIF